MASLVTTFPSSALLTQPQNLNRDKSSSLRQQQIYLLSIYTLWIERQGREPSIYLDEIKLDIADSIRVKHQIAHDFSKENSLFIKGYFLSMTEFAIMAFAGAEYQKYLLS